MSFRGIEAESPKRVKEPDRVHLPTRREYYIRTLAEKNFLSNAPPLSLSLSLPFFARFFSFFFPRDRVVSACLFVVSFCFCPNAGPHFCFLFCRKDWARHVHWGKPTGQNRKVRSGGSEVLWATVFGDPVERCLCVDTSVLPMKVASKTAGGWKSWASSSSSTPGSCYVLAGSR